MGKYIKTFEQFISSKENYEISLPISDADISELMSTDWERSFRSEQEAINYIKYFADDFFPTLPETVTLYRIITMTDPASLNLNKLGNHYTLDKSILTNEMFISSIGIEVDELEEDESLYIITAQVNKSDISLYMTLAQRLLNSDEEEIFVKTGVVPEIINVEKVEV